MDQKNPNKKQRNGLNYHKRLTNLNISGYPPNTSCKALKNFLIRFGAINNIHFYQSYLNVQYSNLHSIRQIMKNKLIFDGVELKVKKSLHNYDRNRNSGKSADEANTTQRTEQQVIDNKPIEIQKLIDLLSENDDFNTQLLIFSTEMAFPYQKFIQNEQLLIDIEMALQVMFPGCKVYPFGSTVTGLAFKGSDVDVFVAIPPEIQIRIANSTKNTLAVYCVQESRRLLYRSNLFTKVICIDRAKTPIVKCIHKPTGINCDINFKNMLGVCNSRLVQYLLNTDPRLRTFFMIIKYWAKIYDLSGPGKLTNYALVMMTIFYLQLKSILPSVQSLQSEHNAFIIDGWNAGWNPINFFVYNQESVPELLSGFYEFYYKYEFAINVIVPYLGRSLQRIKFAHIDKLDSNAFWRYKNQISNGESSLKYETCMCVQDPFEHNHNLTKAIKLPQLTHFQECCKNAWLHCCHILRERKFSNLLIDLFDMSRNNVSKPNPDLSSTNLIVIPASTMLLKSYEDVTEDTLRKQWFEEMNRLLLIILKHVLKMDLEIKQNECTPESNVSKAQKLTNTQDVHDDSIIDTINIHCKAYYPLYGGRKKIKQHQLSKPFVNILQTEIDISEHLMTTIFSFNAKNASIKEPIIEFNIKFICRQRPTQIVLQIDNDMSKKQKIKNGHFFPFLTFLQRTLPVWLENFFQEGTFENEESFSVKNTPDVSNI